MADVIAHDAGHRPPPHRRSHDAPDDTTPDFLLIELLFFAYRDFVRGPDAILSSYSFGRAHHRVLHFVNRHPGLKVTELLDILKITKQSLGRVLRELVDQGFIESRAGTLDRRQRLLHATEKGAALALELADLQTRRIAEAVAATGENGRDAAARFLSGMIDDGERDAVLRRITGGNGSGA